MSTSEKNFDYEGSYLLGEADGEIWSGHAHPNDSQGLSLLSPDEIGQRDVFGQEAGSWLRDKAETYIHQDPRFEAYSYYEGFLSAVRRSRQARAFSVAAGGGRRW